MALASRREIEQLAAEGRYLDAERAVQHNEMVKQARAATLQRELAEAQMRQWRAFGRAKERLYADARLAAAARQEHTREALQRKYDEDRSAHAEELDVRVRRERTVLLRRPVTLSPYAVALRRDEQNMSLQHKYIEAAALQTLATRVEADERRAAHAARLRQLDEQLQRHRAFYRDKEHAALKNLRARMRLEQLACEPRLACAQARMQHMEDDMAAAHATQRRQLRQRGVVPRASHSQQCKAQRGTLLERRVLGDAYTIPSLCSLYGHLLDEATQQQQQQSQSQSQSSLRQLPPLTQ